MFIFTTLIGLRWLQLQLPRNASQQQNCKKVGLILLSLNASWIDNFKFYRRDQQIIAQNPLITKKWN